MEPARASRLRTVLRLLVLGALVCVVAVIVLLVGMVVASVTGLSFDPHGYTMLGGIAFAAVLTPVALLLWVLHHLLRRPDR